VWKFFVHNYNNYLSLITAGSCVPTTGTPPAVPTLEDMVTHVYGFVPWNDCGHGVADSATNPLDKGPINTPNYQAVHKTYVDLQYLLPLGTFNPYVNLVHGSTYLDMPGSYAFSIDDLVGNINVPGTGVILTVAGPNGLENTVQYDLNKIVTVNLGDPGPLGRPAWNQYGFCGGVAARTIVGNRFVINSVNYPCTVVLTDATNRSYTFTLASPFYPPPNGDSTPISNCTVTPPDTTMTWCNGATAQTLTDPTGLKINSVSVSAPLP
jgi:hypothetical protein